MISPSGNVSCGQDPKKKKKGTFNVDSQFLRYYFFNKKKHLGKISQKEYWGLERKKKE